MENDFSQQRRKSNFWRVVFIFFVLWLVILQVTQREAGRRTVERVESPPPDWFPVIVFNRDAAEALPFGFVSSYAATNPDYTFLAPIGQESSIEQKLVESLRKRGAPHIPEIKVTQLAPDRQLIEVAYYEDGEMIALYEATDKEIRPRTITQRGPLFSFLVYGVSFTLSLIIFGVIYGLIKLVRAAVSSRPQPSH